MPWIYLDIPLTIMMKEPLHIGSGFERGLVQRTVVRERLLDQQWRVYIPGSSLKGKARNACEDLARAAELDICNAPSPLNMCREERCLICRTFGRPGAHRAWGRCLHWHDAHLTAEWQREINTWSAAQTLTRTQVQLSRVRGTALEDHLYTSEFATPGISFAGRVSGWLDATSCIEGGYYELNLLLAGLQMIAALGGSRSRGAGYCTITLPETVNIREVGQSKAQPWETTELLAAAASIGLFSMEKGKDNG